MAWRRARSGYGTASARRRTSTPQRLVIQFFGTMRQSNLFHVKHPSGRSCLVLILWALLFRADGGLDGWLR